MVQYCAVELGHPYWSCGHLETVRRLLREPRRQFRSACWRGALPLRRERRRQVHHDEHAYGCSSPPRGSSSGWPPGHHQRATPRHRSRHRHGAPALHAHSVFTVAENIVLADEPTNGVQLDIAGAEQRVRELSDRYGLSVDPTRARAGHHPSDSSSVRRSSRRSTARRASSSSSNHRGAHTAGDRGTAQRHPPAA